METYLLKKEFFPMIGVSSRQWDRRKKELLAWLENFYDFEIIEGQPIRIVIKEHYGEYSALPRKFDGWKCLKQAKLEDYKNFIFKQLGVEYKPISKAKLAREAIKEFALKKYGHSNEEAIAKRFIKPIFDEYAETNGKNVWVFYSTYERMSEEAQLDWQDMLKKAQITTLSAANAFYSEDDEEEQRQKYQYKIARDKFREKYNDEPLLVKEWRLKEQE